MKKIIEKDGKTLQYQIEKKKIKNTYFRLKEDYVHITTNKYVKEVDIKNLLYEKFEKLYKRLETRIPLKDDQIKLWDKVYQFQIKSGRFEYQINDDIISCQSLETDILKIKKLIYKEELSRKIKTLRTKILTTLDKVDIEELPYKLKYLKSKYGSYHRRHLEITLNTFLATLDPVYIEYVIYHEYAHHKVFNHSKAFYNVLDEMMIDHKKIQRQLKKMEII